jgi:opacity protein-like surface antigen
MIRHRTVLAMLSFSVLAAVCLLGGVSPAVAADSDRGEKWQFYIPITYIGSETIGGENGTSVDLNSDFSWGFAFGYNFNERFHLGFEITWIDMNYDVTVAQDLNMDGNVDSSFTAGGVLDASTIGMTGQFNFMDTTVTPFIRAGLGSTYVDSNIPSGSSSTACWWDPWYGYICGTWQDTFSDNFFSYSGAVGVRADMSDTFFLELSYNSMWIDTDRGETPNFTGVRMNIGWLF